MSNERSDVRCDGKSSESGARATRGSGVVFGGLAEDNSIVRVVSGGNE